MVAERSEGATDHLGSIAGGRVEHGWGGVRKEARGAVGHLRRRGSEAAQGRRLGHGERERAGTRDELADARRAEREPNIKHQTRGRGLTSKAVTTQYSG